MKRGRNFDTTKYFDEIYDDSSTAKCMRARCLSCGFSRAKNTTRQIEHLAICQEFLASSQGQQALASGELEMTPVGARNHAPGKDIWRGGAPNPTISAGSASRSVSSSLNTNARMPPPPLRQAPSLANHLVGKWPDKMDKATQQQFLSHAGCGTLSASALSHWLGQNSHVSRAMVSFIGSLIGKVRLSETSNSKVNTQYRALDLLISTVSNLRKEIDFIESTKRKYAIQSDGKPPSPITKAYIDLLMSAADTRSTLLEGMVVLWATEHASQLYTCTCYCVSWQYASNFANTVPSSNYSHVSALQEALIPNWTSREFSKFVEACRAIVDELANAETTGSGREQLVRCELQYQQVVYLWERLWPEIDGMGEENELNGTPARDNAQTGGRPSSNIMAGPSGTNGTTGHIEQKPIEIEDDDNEGNQDAPMGPNGTDSPYGGTGLGAIAAANQAG
ncbi:hypothetical protein DOTSEDRAFT_149350 [Dothistroma septosporum NZE10]|uniref:Thiaminase-2/PQQC domain-containing protein n=1 Tax=Dothistroma septosporum (strain NZE10 / CBS 128990) TaxID=675120 RepID=N1PV95_DOTSN|nr:hypothetical protein DOTSEDRAFT_149350 [Dothistroma septosporum NZE10]